MTILFQIIVQTKKSTRYLKEKILYLTLITLPNLDLNFNELSSMVTVMGLIHGI